MRQSLRHIYRTEVLTPKGKRYGRVREALFDPAKPVVVGYIVERPRILYLLDRADRHLARDCAQVSADAITLTASSGVFDKPAAKRLGIDWELTVVWTGMPVRTASGKVLGTVRDGVFDTETGRLERLEIGSGATADAAVGTRVIPAEQVVGFADGAVTVADEAAAVATSGGAAAVAGRSAAVAKAQAQEAAKTAAVYGKAAAKVAQDSSAGKKAKGWLRSVRDEFVEGMSDDGAKGR